MSLEDGKVLDTVMLETLAVIAETNERSLVEELNRAVRTYVMNELAVHGELRLLEGAVSGEARALAE
jgi:alkyl hydroperoxide reductase subunit AhpF